MNQVHPGINIGLQYIRNTSEIHFEVTYTSTVPLNQEGILLTKFSALIFFFASTGSSHHLHIQVFLVFKSSSLQVFFVFESSSHLLLLYHGICIIMTTGLSLLDHHLIWIVIKFGSSYMDRHLMQIIIKSGSSSHLDHHLIEIIIKSR